MGRFLELGLKFTLSPSNVLMAPAVSMGRFLELGLKFRYTAPSLEDVIPCLNGQIPRIRIEM